MPEYVDLDPAVLEGVRKACLALPEAWEEPAWAGIRWRIRTSTFAHLIAVTNPMGIDIHVVSFRIDDEERDVLLEIGHPFYAAGWGNRLSMLIDDDVDWSEVTELMMESYCTFAPKKLIALLDRPS